QSCPVARHRAGLGPRIRLGPRLHLGRLRGEVHALQGHFTPRTGRAAFLLQSRSHSGFPDELARPPALHPRPADRRLRRLQPHRPMAQENLVSADRSRQHVAGDPLCHPGRQPRRHRRHCSRRRHRHHLLGHRRLVRSHGRHRPAPSHAFRLVPRPNLFFPRPLLLPQNAHVSEPYAVGFNRRQLMVNLNFLSFLVLWLMAIGVWPVPVSKFRVFSHNRYLTFPHPALFLPRTPLHNSNTSRRPLGSRQEPQCTASKNAIVPGNPCKSAFVFLVYFNSFSIFLIIPKNTSASAVLIENLRSIRRNFSPANSVFRGPTYPLFTSASSSTFPIRSTTSIDASSSPVPIFNFPFSVFAFFLAELSTFNFEL